MISSTQSFICKEILLLLKKSTTNRCTNNSAARASTQNVGVSSAHHAHWIPYRSDIHEPWQLSWLRRHPAEVSQKCWTSRTALGQLAISRHGIHGIWRDDGRRPQGISPWIQIFIYLSIYLFIYYLFICLFAIRYFGSGLRCTIFILWIVQIM